MAALNLIMDSNYHDNFEEHYNYTDHEKYIVEEIKGLSKADWFRKQKGSFETHFSAPFAETMTGRGLAFTFNIWDFGDLMNSER